MKKKSLQREIFENLLNNSRIYRALLRKHGKQNFAFSKNISFLFYFILDNKYTEWSTDIPFATKAVRQPLHNTPCIKKIKIECENRSKIY